MVSKLYFPDEHKYAIYTPLFGPLALPLLMALLGELQLIVKGWKARRIKPSTTTEGKEENLAMVGKDGAGSAGESKLVIVSETTTLVSE